MAIHLSCTLVSVAGFALRFGRNRAQHAIAGVLALATVGYIVSVAVIKNPLGF